MLSLSHTTQFCPAQQAAGAPPPPLPPSSSHLLPARQQAAFLWQLMRFNMLQLLKNLRSRSQGKEITDTDILKWANKKVKSTGRLSQMESFKDKKLSSGLFFLELLSSVEPRVVNWNLVSKGESDEEKKLNATYIISVARKLGCSIFLLPEDIMEVNQKMILMLTASIMYWSLQQQPVEERESSPSPSPSSAAATTPDASPAPSLSGDTTPVAFPSPSVNGDTTPAAPSFSGDTTPVSYSSPSVNGETTPVAPSFSGETTPVVPSFSGDTTPVAYSSPSVNGETTPVALSFSGETTPIALPSPSVNGDTTPVAPPSPSVNGETTPVASPEPSLNGEPTPVACPEPPVDVDYKIYPVDEVSNLTIDDAISEPIVASPVDNGGIPVQNE